MSPGMRRVHSFIVSMRANHSDYAWPGGYPVIAIFESGDVCKPSSLLANLRQAAADIRDGIRGSGLAGFDIHWEGPPETDCFTGEEIESAYGDPDAEDSAEMEVE